MIASNPFEQVRNELNVSRKELSTVLNISHITIQQAEQGMIKNPIKYAEALEQAELVKSADQLLKDQKIWLGKLQKEKLQQLRERS
jgi:DNA-binding XRE family transcriptional regulator